MRPHASKYPRRRAARARYRARGRGGRGDAFLDLSCEAREGAGLTAAPELRQCVAHLVDRREAHLRDVAVGRACLENSQQQN